MNNEHRQNSYMNNGGDNRPRSKVNSKGNGFINQNKGNKMIVDQQILSTNPGREDEDSMIDKYMLQQEIQKLNQQLA